MLIPVERAEAAFLHHGGTRATAHHLRGLRAGGRAIWMHPVDRSEHTVVAVLADAVAGPSVAPPHALAANGAL
jgi:hypothetical protein